jgi:membrane protein XagC
VSRAVSGTVAVVPVASLAFVAALALSAIAVGNGLIADDAVRLWAGASSAAEGQVPIGRIAAGYPTLPFLATTLISWLAPTGAPAPALVAAGLFSAVVACCLLSFRKAGLSDVTAAIAAVLIALHPAFIRAVIVGPADIFFAVFLLIFCLALYDLRARSGTSEVMGVGLALMALAFSHPLGAAIAFAAVPFLAFAVRPTFFGGSVLNVVVALIFPTVFMAISFAYVSWVFPGDGWSFFAAPAESLSLWTAAVARTFGNGCTGIPAIDASLAMGAALAVGAPVAPAMLWLVGRRRPLIIPALVFVATTITATLVSVAGGFFGDPTAIVVAAPVLAAVIVIRVPVVRERVGLVIALLAIGWLGGFLSLALVDTVIINRFHAASDPAQRERLDAIAAGGASLDRDGILADTDNAPALLLGRGRARGMLGPSSEPFALTLLFARVDAPFVAVPDPQSVAGANDRLNRAFPSLFRDGLPGYRIIYQNNTWRLFARTKDAPDSKQ